MKSWVEFDGNGQIIQRCMGVSLPDVGFTGNSVLEVSDPSDADGCYVHRGSLVSIPTAPSKQHVFDFQSKTWIDRRTLDDRKAERWASVKRKRDAAEFGPFSWGALTFDGDAESKSRLSLAAMAAQAAIAAGDGWSVDWTLADNSTVTLSAADVIGVVQAMGANITAAHQAARIKRAAIEAATTVEELDAI